MFNKTRYSFLVFLVFILAIFFAFNKGFDKRAGAASDLYLSGYAWSSNVGWISFDEGVPNPHYAVTYDSSTGLLSGYAWSSNVGWISFGCGSDVDTITGQKTCTEGNPDTPNYPSGGTASSPAIVGTQLVGFARACSVFSAGCSGVLKGPLDRGGWDGWISLNSPNGEYGIVLHNESVPFPKFQGFAWGGGNDGPDIIGRNISPQSPGWITFDPNIGGVPGDGDCFDGIQNGTGAGEETSVDQGGRCDFVVKLCADATCGESNEGIECSTDSYPIVNDEITWTATVNPPGNYSYQWILQTGNPLVDAKTAPPPPDYILAGGSLTSPTFSLNYKKTGSWFTDVLVTNIDTGLLVGHCQADIGKSCPAGVDGLCYEVGDKTFEIHTDVAMNTQFIRSINSVTFPDVTISVVPRGGFTGPIRIDFSTILGPDGSRKDGADRALLVDAQFWRDADPASITSFITLNQTGVDANGRATYDTAKLRLKLTKNQDAPEQFKSLPSSKNYSVVIKGTGSGIVAEHGIQLILSNPSGGVIER